VAGGGFGLEAIQDIDRHQNGLATALAVRSRRDTASLTVSTG